MHVSGVLIFQETYDIANQHRSTPQFDVQNANGKSEAHCIPLSCLPRVHVIV